MKKLYVSIFFGLFICNLTYANIFNCFINDQLQNGQKIEIKFEINVDDNVTSELSIENQLFSKDGYKGQLIVKSSSYYNLNEGSYNSIATHNSKKGGSNHFKALFSENPFEGRIHLLSISVWNKDMPIHLFFSDYPLKVFKGTCK